MLSNAERDGLRYFPTPKVGNLQFFNRPGVVVNPFGVPELESYQPDNIVKMRFVPSVARTIVLEPTGNRTGDPYVIRAPTEEEKLGLMPQETYEEEEEGYEEEEAHSRTV